MVLILFILSEKLEYNLGYNSVIINKFFKDMISSKILMIKDELYSGNKNLFINKFKYLFELF